MLRRFPLGGTVPRDDHVYVGRPEDEDVRRTLAEGRWANLHGARMMGKSSLAIQLQQRLRESGLAVAYSSVENIITEVHTPDTDTFLGMVAREWASDLSIGIDNVALSGAVKLGLPGIFSVLRDAVAKPLVLILDEVDLLTRAEYGLQFLNTLRVITERRARESGYMPDVQMLLVSLRPVSELMPPTEGAAAQFCVPLRLADFRPDDPAAAAAIAAGWPPEWPESTVTARRILDLSGGQPLLTMKLAWEFAGGKIATLADLELVAFRYIDGQKFSPDPLFRVAEELILADKTESISALSTYTGLLLNRPESSVGDAPGVRLLLLSGIVRVASGRIEVKGPLFRRYFDAAWADRMLAKAASASRVQIQAVGKSLKRVCIVNTGGTIGMVPRGERIVKPDSPEEFLAYHPELRQLANVDFEQLWGLDSINVYPSEWEALAKYIFDRRRRGYAGFVVAHGTDTMAYTASAVAFALGPNLSFPVVFTGAQTTPDRYHGDARTNLYRAVLAAQQPMHEVVICFGDRVLRACRAQKRDDQRYEGFESPTYPELAIVTEDVNVRRELLRPAPHRGVDIELRATFMPGIVEIAQVPGLEPEFYERIFAPGLSGSLACNGVIIQTFGAGNVATREPYSLLPLITKLNEQQIPVLITSQYPPDPLTFRKYSPAAEPITRGGIPAVNMSSPAAVSKFRWVLAQVDEMLRRGEIELQQRIAQVKQMMIEIDSVGELALPETNNVG